MLNFGSNMDDLFKGAVRLHQAGRLAQADAAYRQVLQQNPRHADALHMLGVLAAQANRRDIALDLIRQAIAIRPGFADAQNNLGNVLKELGRTDEAIAAYREAIRIKPNYSSAHSNLGNALRDKGLLEEAVAAYRQAIIHQPKNAEAYNNLGCVLAEMGRVVEAIAAYEQAIGLQPGAPAYYNLGNSLKLKGELEKAIEAYRQALARQANYPEAWSNLGNALESVGRLDEAIAAYRQSIALRPNEAETYCNLGIALKSGGQLDAAIAVFHQAISLNGKLADAYTNLGNALGDAGRMDEAIAAHRQAVGLNPDFVKAHSNLVFGMQYNSYDARGIAEELGRWNRRHAEPLKRFIQPHENDRDPERRLRIGYLSADFRGHASANFLMPVLEQYSPKEVEVFCYAQVQRPDEMTRRMREEVSQWRSIVGQSDEEVAELIRSDRIDILVDLKLHTAENRLLIFARKPAPVQVTWLGYPGSTGLETMDYRLSDAYLDPPGMDESVYSERTIRLPDSFWCYDPLEGSGIPVVAPPCLKSGHITFGSLNNFCKMNDALMALWARVLREVKGSRMLVLAREGSHRQRLLDRMRGEGIEGGRVEFVPRQSSRGYLESYHRIDIGLDTFPCNGHTTSLDALWMGVPVVSLVGKTTAGRAGLSVLSNVGLVELAARDEEEYVRIAVELAGDRGRLEQLRSGLRQRMRDSPLMDARRFAQNMEAAYRQMWRAWCATAG